MKDSGVPHFWRKLLVFRPVLLYYMCRDGKGSWVSVYEPVPNWVSVLTRSLVNVCVYPLVPNITLENHHC